MIAKLSNDNKYTIFRYGKKFIKIRSPYSLEYYKKVLNWKDGVIIVLAKYKHNEELEEEYIDISTSFDELYIDARETIKDISEVIVDND